MDVNVGDGHQQQVKKSTTNGVKKSPTGAASRKKSQAGKSAKSVKAGAAGIGAGLDDGDELSVATGALGDGDELSVAKRTATKSTARSKTGAKRAQSSKKSTKAGGADPDDDLDALLV